MNDEKIGMYLTDEILTFMTEGEGRGFLGRSMFDAMYFEIKKLKKQLEAYENMRKEAIEYIKLYSGEDNNFCLDYHELNPLLDILNKVGDSNE